MRSFKLLSSTFENTRSGMRAVSAVSRILLAVVICAGVATVSFAQSSEDGQRGEDGQRVENGFEAKVQKHDITGTWLVKITPDEPGALPFDGLYTFTSDGIALFSSVGPPIPGLGNPGHGVWVRTGPNTFVATFKQFTFNDIFTTNGSLVIKSRITLKGANHIKSEDVGAIFDVNGNPIITIGGKQQGTRMTID